jgi:hypothetical protein
VVGVDLGAWFAGAPIPLIAVVALAHLPFAVVAAVAMSKRHHRRRARRRAAGDEQRRLASRVDEAEAVLAHDQELMHELRATVTSVVMSQRLLASGRGRPPKSQQRRLERVLESGLERMERLLADAEREPVEPVSLAGRPRPGGGCDASARPRGALGGDSLLGGG